MGFKVKKSNSVRLLVLTAVVFLLVAAGCTTGFDKSTLANMQYIIDITESGRVDLVNGVYEEAAAAGSASKVVVRLDASGASGDIDGNGISDSAVILQAEGGGSGSFSYLAVVLNQTDKPAALDAVFLGDRILIEGLGISEGVIQVDIIDRKSGESMSVFPSVKKVLLFQLIDGVVVVL